MFFSHRPLCAATLNSNFAELKLFSITVRKLFEPMIVLRGGGEAATFCSFFKKHFLEISLTQNLSNDQGFKFHGNDR